MEYSRGVSAGSASSSASSGGTQLGNSLGNAVCVTIAPLVTSQLAHMGEKLLMIQRKDCFTHLTSDTVPEQVQQRRLAVADLGVVGVAAAAGGQVQQAALLPRLGAVLAQQPQQRLAQRARQVAAPLQDG